MSGSDDIIPDSALSTQAPGPSDDILPSSAFSSAYTKSPAKAVEASDVPLTVAGGGLIRHEITSLGSSAVAGARSVYDLITGVPLAEVDRRNQDFIGKHTYQPKDATTKGLVSAFESDANPLNWIGKGFDILGDAINKATDSRTWAEAKSANWGGNPLLADKAGAPIAPPSTALPTTGSGSTALGPIVSGALQVGAGAAPFIGDLEGLPAPRKAAGWGPEATESASVPPSALSVAETSRAPAFEVEDVPGKPGTPVDSAPVEGGLPNSATNSRAAILKRVGLENARESALTGDAKSAATDWQLSKFDEPAGVAAKAQFDAERDTLQNHSQNLVKQTGGTLGTDEDSLNLRGQTITQPFDALSDWFDQKRKQLYAAADQRSGGHPVVQPSTLQELLSDPSFQNQLTAKNQMHVLNGVSAELDRFTNRNQTPMTVQNAEQFRQFLNTLWTKENSSVIGKLKGALDDDVMKGAGEDIYAPARALVHMRKQTLDNPSGIFKLMEHDPQTPINRTTPFEKVPDLVTRLPVQQFDNVLKTLDTMPEEIQPAAQAAKAEIKAHLANKIHDAGSSTSGQWNANGVEKVIKANSAKLQTAFADQPEILKGIQDLRSAGNILSVNQSYPGAAAQASNAVKRGFMSRALSSMGATAGAGAGSILGPFGAAGGAAAGEVLGSKAGASLSEKSALKNWKKGVKNLADVK